MTIADFRCHQFINRDSELRLLREWARGASVGHGSMVFVSGEPGIGKTRLLTEVLRFTKAFSMQSASGHCLEHARSPLGPLSDIVRTLHRADPSVLQAARGVRHVLARLVPEVEPDPAPAADADSARSQYAAIAEMLRGCGERRPSVLVIEDAHWADLSTLEFLRYFAGRIGQMRLLMLVSFRAQEVAAHGIAPLISALRRQPNFYALELAPFTPAVMQQFVRSASGMQQLEFHHLRRIRDLADGNPLFAEELLASAVEDGAAPRNLPASVREIFLERIGQLDNDDREILVEAAVLGRRFDAGFLAQFTRRPLERILLALRRARSLQLIVEDSEHEEHADDIVGGAVFRHPLVRETLYSSILTAEARRLHRRIFRELEALSDPEPYMAALAYHSWAARDAESALIYSELAGDDAMRKLATMEAAVFYERAISFVKGPDELRGRLYRKLASAYSGSGLAGQAIDAFTHAYTLFEHVADMRSMAEVSLLIGREHTARAQGDESLKWRIAGLEKISALPDEPFLFAALTSVALGYAMRGDVARAAPLIERAAGFSGTRASAVQASLHDAAGMVDLLSGHTERALSRYERAGAEALALGNATLASRVYGNLYFCASVLGQMEIATHAATEALRLTDEVLVPMYRPYALVIAGKSDAAAGQLDRARRRLAQAEDAAAGLDSPRLHSQLVILGLFLAQHLDEPDLVERFSGSHAIDHAFTSREPWWIGGIASVFADFYGRVGRSGEAEALIHRSLLALPTIVLSPELAITAAIYGADEDLPVSRDLLHAWSRAASAPCGRAFLGLFDAYAARRAGRSPAGLAKSAAALFEALPLPFYAAKAYELAGDHAAALAIYKRVESTADIARLSGGPATVEAAEAQFTRREQEVFSLVADGRSNREIATVMSISERTVESHVRSILSKVDGRSRVDLIKLAETRHLSAPRR